jgi:cytochrome b involved in lipid metabolism
MVGTNLTAPSRTKVYDVASWVHKHPGGKVLLTYVGEDATDSVAAFHRDEEQMRKYLSSMRVATLDKGPLSQVLFSGASAVTGTCLSIKLLKCLFFLTKLACTGEPRTRSACYQTRSARGGFS